MDGLMQEYCISQMLEFPDQSICLSIKKYSAHLFLTSCVIISVTNHE